MKSKLLFCLLVIFLGESLGYNLATNREHKGVVILDNPIREANPSLFGWSVHFEPKFKDDAGAVFVGAPQLNKTGGIFSCSTTKKSCSLDEPANTRWRDREEGWMGASIAGDNGHVYTCAPFLDNKYCMKPKKCCDRVKRTGECDCENPACCKDEKIKSRIFGECYKYNAAEKEFRRFTEIRYSDKTNPISKTWSRSGPFGYASVVADDGHLVLGAPITTTLLHHFEGKSDTERSGTIVKYFEEYDEPNGSPPGSLLFPDAEIAPFRIKQTEMDEGSEKMRNTLNLAGMSLVKVYNSRISEGNRFSYLIGAPKADNNRGKAHICINCFTKSIKGFQVKPDEDNRQIGERFGESVTACDVNGDDNDDVIVGAPFYSHLDNQDYNVGRVHVFLMEIPESGGKDITVSKAVPPTLMGKDLTRNSRFGAAMACLGDTDGDRHQEVVIGAPYYSSEEGEGAIFIFRGSLHGLQAKPSQIIKASRLSKNNQPISGFGISLFSRGSVHCPDDSHERVPDCSQCDNLNCPYSDDCTLRTGPDKKPVCVSKTTFGSQNGLTIGSHMSQNVIHMQFRKVTRIEDVTVVDAPSKYDPETSTSKTITVKVTPKLFKKSRTQVATYQDIEATVTVNMDRLQDRIPEKQKRKSTIISVGKLMGESLDFVFSVKNIDVTGGNSSARDPITVDVKVEWKMANCRDGTDNLCSVLDPSQVNGVDSVTRSISVTPIVIKTGCSSDGCHCIIKSSMDTTKHTLVAGERELAGEKPEEHIGTLTIENHGSEPAFGTKVTITLNPDTTRVASVGKKCTEQTSLTGKQTFVCPYVAKKKGGSEPSDGNIGPGDVAERVKQLENPSIELLPITLDVSSMWKNTTAIQMDIQVTSDCNDPASSTENGNVALTVEHKWSITTKPFDGQDGDNFNWDYRNDDKRHTIVHNFEVVNAGPSSSSGGELFVFIPASSTMLSAHNVKLQNIQCQDAPSKQIPGDIRDQSCAFDGTCVVRRCNLPDLKQKQSATLVVSVIFSLENAKNKENEETLRKFEVITSVQTNDGQNEQSLSTYKSTLEYRDKNFLTTLTNYWYVVVGAVIGIIFIIIICLILWKCNVFSKIRIYKKEIEEVNEAEEVEMRTERVDSKEEATFDQTVVDD